MPEKSNISATFDVHWRLVRSLGTSLIEVVLRPLHFRAKFRSLTFKAKLSSLEYHT